MKSSRLDVPVPERLARRPKDRRGFPIPWVNLVDEAGVPHFTINDHHKVIQAVNEQLCGLCGEKLDNGGWFVGGPRCFVSEMGAFVDPNMHEDCAKYALMVCPFLAVKGYNKRIDDKLLKPENVAVGMKIVNMEMEEAQPPFFGLGMVASYAVVPHGGLNQFVFVPQALDGYEKFLKLSWWKDGEEIDNETASALWKAHVEKLAEVVTTD